MTPTAHESAVAAAFASRMPTTAEISARASHASGDTGDAVIATYVGETSAELAALVLDPTALVDGVPDASLVDRLHDAIDAAAATLGPGVLGDASIGDASALFSHPQAQIFDLQDEAGRTVGRLAVRVTRTAADTGHLSSRRLQRIAGVEMDLTVEIGRTRMAVRDVLDLTPGRIVELDRSAGAPADIKLNGRLIAHGEIVVVDQDYAVRITRILENAEV
ncbi:flagellar motor switch protein FliN [Microbacterium sp. JZ31]|uniref:flagellar motor switch protein FliN n=1 Tax=Microbacterium sp. JZ31 TaxID=1906274 RepID=UPI001EE47F4E|nr:flagellar motor switch protein FliN [Microbacterium sp. JZ31]